MIHVLVAALLLGQAGPPPATELPRPASADAQAERPEDEAVIENLELLRQLDVLDALDLLDEADDPKDDRDRQR
ncbi:MAG TPA: hypothetical protein VM753_06320 [Anaeromyxobacter sp.]|jgi:hypothetical protein|nr:hypothetical protein [Anaeromyxobacter sp.]